ncbi:MAG: Gfo/Idh/MocA family oxidoreductase [Armatimonadota bacterium]|nr:MAG: Gfo/Idh/MocA family oxidoreductase [Armatimonadota bacterium]
MPDQVTRREFLKKAGGTAAAAAVVGPMFLSESARGANDKIIMGAIGVGGMGSGDVGFFRANPDVEFAAVCDIDQNRLREAVGKAGGKATPYSDFRKLLERKDIDAVIVATPDHWHALATIAACEAGKDVYCEKPIATSVGEGRAMVNAARRYGRVVQIGTQQRSGTHFQRAVEIVRSGGIGKVTLCRVWNVDNELPDGIGNPPNGDPPPELDYDMWLGPAPKRPYNPNRCHYYFRYFWDYAGGKITDWGTHLIDIIHWGMGVDAPLAVAASGAKYVMPDNRETPDTMEAIYDYPGFTMVYSYRGASDYPMSDHGYGMQFHGTQGTLFVDRGGFEVIPDEDSAIEPVSSGGSAQNEPHVRNFLDCVKSRARPICDAEITHRSTTACHLGNIALLTGRKIHWDRENERIINDAEANRLLTKPYRAPWHL